MLKVHGQPEAGKYCHRVEIGVQVQYAYTVDTSEAIALVRADLGIGIADTTKAKVEVVDAPPVEEEKQEEEKTDGEVDPPAPTEGEVDPPAPSDPNATVA